MKFLKNTFLPLAFYFLMIPCVSQSVGLKDNATEGEAWRTADRLLESLGGKELWASTKVLYIKELAFPSSLKDSVIAEFWRDLEKPKYRSLIRGSNLERETVWSKDGGWVVKNGVRTQMTKETVAEEVLNWYQEPYVMYHKLAIRDPSLQLVLKHEKRLEIYSMDGKRILCWFEMDANGGLLLWGNYYQGEVSEHVYGPGRQIGAFRMPSWGTATNGSWRFEYVDVKAITNE